MDEECFDEWVNVQRQRMQLAAFRLCETYATRPDLVSDGQQAVAVVERLMALDLLRENWQRLALTLYARYRGKNEALAQAEIFAATLQRELGVAPEADPRAAREIAQARSRWHS
jgi:DNA-binding SARP family transcriptional activator